MTEQHTCNRLYPPHQLSSYSYYSCMAECFCSRDRRMPSTLLSPMPLLTSRSIFPSRVLFRAVLYCIVLCSVIPELQSHISLLLPCPFSLSLCPLPPPPLLLVCASCMVCVNPTPGALWAHPLQSRDQLQLVSLHAVREVG